MSKVFSIILLILLFLVNLFAGIDLKQLDKEFESARKDWEVPGMAIAIVQNDEVIFEQGYGIREVGHSSPVDEHTLFAIASNTKSFTAAALAILADEGKVDWDDKVKAYLPYFQLYDSYVSSETTIRDLLCHRIGLKSFSGDLIWYGTDYPREEVIRRARFLQPTFSFRDGYGYSNIMYIAAGEVIEAITGQSWEDFVGEKFLQPLNMKNTIFSVKELKGKLNVATPHGKKNGNLKKFAWYKWDNSAPAGGIISSVHEMANWLLLQINRGKYNGKEIFSEKQWQVMQTPHNNFRISSAAKHRNPYTSFRGYGLGWGVSDYKGQKIGTHGGAYDGMYSRMVIVPERKFGFIILTNGMTGIAAPLGYRILDELLGGEKRDWNQQALKRDEMISKQKKQKLEELNLRRILNTKPSLPLEKYSGIYGGNVYGDAEVILHSGKLLLKLLANPDLTGDLTHWHLDVFEVSWRHEFPWFGKGKVQFVLNEYAEITEMKINVPNHDFWFEELDLIRKSETEIPAKSSSEQQN